MGTLTVASVISKVATILQDSTNVRWPQAELLDWLNDGQREIALYKPNAFAKNQSMALVAGTKQTLPSDGLSLIDVVRNMGTGGTTAGNAVRMVSREILDSQINGWHASTPSATIKHFVYSPLDPKTFYVYPPASTPTYVEIIYGATPTDATLVGNITLDDIYVTALINYVVYRAYSKDAEFAANKDLAMAYYQNFAGLLTGKVNAETITNPATALGGMNPNVAGSMK